MNLSDKEIYLGKYHREDVKQFIKDLKEEMPNESMNDWKAQQEFIDEKAGEKLI